MQHPIPKTPVAYYKRYGLHVRRCRDCLADIYLVRHVKTEKRCAINAEHDKDGNIRILGRQHRYEVLTPATPEPPDETRSPFRHTRHDCLRRRP